ncbi:MAG: 1,4-alpha-glucan branching protein GlgB [Pirellulaceae bacterium]
MHNAVKLESIGALVQGCHENPFELLGPHLVENRGEKSLAVRAYLPHSKQAWVTAGGEARKQAMRRIHPSGLYEAIVPWLHDERGPRYELHVEDHTGRTTKMHDPYAFSPLLSEFDLYLIGEGRHWRAYDKLGAHVRTIDGVTGVNFAVWAPNAKGVAIVGDFNQWDGRRHPMRKHIPSGVWELFIPDLDVGSVYKFRVNQNGHYVDKTDPVGFAAEVPPRTASIVADLDAFTWSDQHWMQRRADTNWLERPVNIYEVHLGSWRKDPNNPSGWIGYRELAKQLGDYCSDMGFTHVEMMPVSEHPFTGSWGYQTVGYFAATSRYGSPEDFMYMVNYLHSRGIGVILDWVPAHFPKDDHGLRRFDGSALYEHEDPRQGEHPDWGTLIFNYGRSEVRNFLLSNALFWLDKYHIDGLRVDAVASMLYLDYSREDGQWIPNQYGGRENLEAISLLKEFNEQAHAQFPGVLTIAEESTAWGGVSRPTFTGGLGFSLKWNMGWMNDTLRYMRDDPIHRRYHHNELTFSMIYAFTENFCLPLSHDEVVHGKGSLLDQMPGDLWQKNANLRLLYSYMWTHPGKKLLFMGSEFGQWNEWNCDDSLQWDLLQWEMHQGVQKMIRDLNLLIQNEPALYEQDFVGEGFEWIDCQSADESVLAFLRKGKDPNDTVLVAMNFTPVPRESHRIGVPQLGWYQEKFNSDSSHYGGSNLGNYPGVSAEEVEWHGRPYSIQVKLPPLATVIFKPE